MNTHKVITLYYIIYTRHFIDAFPRNTSIINYCTNINLLYHFCINKISKTPLIKFPGALSDRRPRTTIQVNLISRPLRETPILVPADNKTECQKATRKRNPNLRGESTFKHILSRPGRILCSPRGSNN